MEVNPRTRSGLLTLAGVLLDLIVRGQLVLEVRDQPVPIDQVRVALDNPDYIVLEVASGRQDGGDGEPS